MNPKILTIVPTRNRNPIGFYQSFVENTKHSDLVFVVIENHHKKEFHIEGASYEIIPPSNRTGFVFPLNYAARKYCNQYTHLAFLGDDIRIRTKDWDDILYESIKDIQYGIAYPNDLLQGENLPTHVMLDSQIVQTLGYMVPDIFVHQYADNFWKDLGEALNTLRYLPNVLIEHMHFINNKAKLDSTYQEILNVEQVSTERYYEYKNSLFNQDVNKLIFNLQ